VVRAQPGNIAEKDTGQAHLAQKNGSAAAAEFQKLLDHLGLVKNGLLGSLAHLQIARA
jgi:hypothetical protein